MKRYLILIILGSSQLLAGDRVFVVPLARLDDWTKCVVAEFDNVTITGNSPVHPQGDDCEMHFGAKVEGYTGDPEGVVLEPMNICVETFFARMAYKKKDWEDFGRLLAKKKVKVEGVPRLWPEHLDGSESSSNPNHALEVHPLTRLTIGGTTRNFSSFIYIPGQYRGGLSSETAERIVKSAVVHVTTTGSDVEISFDAGQIGNFAMLDLRFQRDKIKAIRGGHRIPGEVLIESNTPGPVSIVTVAGSGIDAHIAKLKSGKRKTIDLEGLILFSLNPETLHDAAAKSSGNPVEVDTPLQLILYGVPEAE